MCGIAGIVRFDKKAVEERHLAEMCRLLHHRGPDDAGWHAQGVAGLANTRLKIIDLSQNARQPIFNEDGSVAVVLNGEIYNYRELRQRLLSLGHVFRSASDTETIVHLYEERGPDCMLDLDGMFAFALWDSRRQQLLLARDRSGKKPLFYFAGEGFLTFGSEIKALFAQPEVPRRVNHGALPVFLAHGYVPCPVTMFERIRQLQAGSRMVVHADGRAESSRYWEFRPVPREMTVADACAGLRSRVEEAVRKRLVSDVPLGGFLSGGIDSSIVVAVMSRLMKEPVRTFSIGFEGDARFDERPYARQVARRYGTTHKEFVVGPQSIDLVERLVWHHDQPFMDSSAIPTYLLAKLAREHVTVALNGDGGDELFAGYRRFRLALALERMPRFALLAAGALAPLLRSAHPRMAAHLSRIAAGAAVNRKLRLWTVSPLFAGGLWLAMRPEFRASTRTVLQHAEQLASECRTLTSLSRLLYCNFYDYLGNDLHVKMDRSTMAHGLEARSPLLDTAVMEFAAALPDDLKLRRGQTKFILREAFRDDLPPDVYARGKMGFGVPLSAWFRKDLREYLRDVFGNGSARLYEYLQPECVQKLVGEFLDGKEFLADAIWTLLTLESWLGQQVVNRAALVPEGICAN